AALLAVAVWLGTTAEPEREASREAGISRPAQPSGSPVEPTSSRSPDALLRGRPVWIAPPASAEAGLATTSGPLPRQLRVDRAYPPLRPGAVQRAVMVLGVVGDTAVLDRLLVLDESGQVFELDLGPMAGPGGPTLSRGALSPDGTRLALGRTGAYVVVDLLSPARQTVHATGGSTSELSWVDGAVVRREKTRVAGDSRTAELTMGIAQIEGLVLRAGGALLVLEGERPATCCAVAGWLDRDRVLYESQTGPQLHLLAWHTGTGRVSLMSTVVPAVSNDSYLLTSYARLDT
ncbi:MAG TPA: hypothetical protein VJ819_08015, partial [Nocardioidaceae bacterium]|nr:hypothetical protein [Nocardioidaceae bacterium]